MQDDWIGSSHVDVIDNTFLTIEVVEVIVEEVGKLDGPFNFALSVELSHVMHEHSRSLVTLLEVVGNIGGFNDAIWLIASSIFCSYSSMMYMRSITNTMPFSSKKDRAQHSHYKALQKRYKSQTSDL